MDTSELRQRVADGMPDTIAALERLVRIPSVGMPGHDPAHVRASAEATAQVLSAAGLQDVRLIELGDGVGHPAVFGQLPGPSGSPTALLYAHHDVQPEGPADQWETPPFEPVIRDGRMYGRGAADDKSGIAIHAAALRALGAADGAAMPATVKVLIEGEEECSTEHLPELVQGHADLLRSDVAIVADGGNYRNGLPTLCTSMRGVTDCLVEVSVMPQAQHSGAYGGPIPDALTALSRIIATLHDDEGNVAIEGLHRFAWGGREVTEEELREESRVLDQVQLTGSGTLADRLLSGPAVAVLGIDAPSVVDSSNQIVPDARARISLRIAPGEDAQKANRLLAEHLQAAAPWGVRVTVEPGEAGLGYLVDADTPAFAAALDALREAYDVDPIQTGSGGSIPLVPMLAETFPGIAALIWGAMDERTNIHSLNESVDLAEVERMSVAEALFLQKLGRSAASG